MGFSRRAASFSDLCADPDAHQAFKTAVTSMCISALIETGKQDSTTLLAIDKAETWLKENLGRLKRATGDAIYNVWGHAYAIQALVRLHQRPGVSDEAKKLYRELIASQMDMLDRYESVDGGWGYYDFRYQARKPTSDSTSFVNATVLVALKEADDIGVKPNQTTVDRAIKATLRQRKPDFSYIYGEYLKDKPMLGINRPAGSLGRSQACNAALRMWGDKEVTDLVLKNWLYRLFVRNGWLAIGRKRPIPHESWFQVTAIFIIMGTTMLPIASRCFRPKNVVRIAITWRKSSCSIKSQTAVGGIFQCMAITNRTARRSRL